MLRENIFHRFSILPRLALLLLFWSAVPAWCADLAFLWDANTEPDLEGYGIYFKDIPDAEYSLYGYVTTQELEDPANPRFTVSGLEKGKTYYFASTAYNWYGLESSFSNSLCVEVGDTIAACSSSDEGSSSSGGGGGGGGGCFIGAIIRQLGG